MMEGNPPRRLLWVIWPAFLVAAVAETIFFSLFDPLEIRFFGAPAGLTREALYSLGFLFFWGLGSASSALTMFLGRSSFAVDRCPLDAPTRPADGPERDTEERPDHGAGGRR
jgi:hypothetical protein